MSKFPKTVAAVQKRDRCMWEIGDALLAECGKPSALPSQNDGSRAKLEAAASEIEHLKIDGYTVDYLAKLRDISNKFPGGIRNPAISWAAHRSSGSPKMLETIVKAVGNKPITNAVVRSMRPVIEKHQEREYREENPGKPLPKRGEMPAPSTKEARGLLLEAESLRYNNKILSCRSEMDDVAEWLEKNLDKLSAIAVDYLVETALSLAEDARRVADVARKLKASRRAHLSVVGE